MSDFHEGDRVRHQKTGEMGIVGKTIAPNDEVTDVWFPVLDDGLPKGEIINGRARRRVSTSLLTKVEPAHPILPPDVKIPPVPEGIEHFPSWTDGWAAGWLTAQSESEKVKHELVEAIRFTQEYALLPALPGWSWHDALKKHAPDVLEAMSPESKPTELRSKKFTVPDWTSPLSEQNADIRGIPVDDVEVDPDGSLTPEQLEDAKTAHERFMARVDPQPVKTLREKLNERAVKVGNDSGLNQLSPTVALEVFREHFDSKRDEIDAVIENVVDDSRIKWLESDYEVTRNDLCSILFDDE